METIAWYVVAALAVWILYLERTAPPAMTTRRQAPRQRGRRPIKVAARRHKAQGSVTVVDQNSEDRRIYPRAEVVESSTVSDKAAAVEGEGVDARQTQSGVEERVREEPERENEDEVDLLSAVLEGDAAAVRKSLKARDVDINNRTDVGVYSGLTALMIAATNDHVEIVRQLLDCDAEVNATKPKDGKTALHLASELRVVEMLLGKSAFVDACDDHGNTPLHLAVRDELEGKVAMLLEHGASVDSTNSNKLKPLHLLLEKISGASRAAVNVPAIHDIAQSLVHHGAKWDCACDQFMTKNATVSLGFRVAIERWIHEHSHGAEALTDIPEVVLRQGPDFVEEYLRAASATVGLQCDGSSKGNLALPILESQSVLRRKVCVVGPSFWGKTSLVKSLAEGKPSLEHPDHRTIGIDQFPMVFSDRVLSSEELFLEACRVGNVNAVRWLIETKRVRVNMPDSTGRTPFHKFVREAVAQNGMAMERGRLQALQAVTQVLISFGAKWDDACDAIVKDKDEASRALREAVHLWREERKQGTKLTTFSEDAYRHGPRGIRAFVAETAIHKAQVQQPIDTDAASSVGWQQTSTTLTTPEQQTESQNSCQCQSPDSSHNGAMNDRSIEDINAFRHHEVVFWDCAGHEAYQVAHSAFFSRRTLYLICVDLHAYAVALEQSKLRANKERDVDRLMDEFVDCKILRWIRLILACQPDAEFVFVGTKADVLMSSKHRIVNVHEDLKMRVKRYAESIGSKSKMCDSGEQFGRLYLRGASSIPQTAEKFLYQALSTSAKRLRNFDWLTVSCKDKKSIKAARKAIEQILVKSKRSFRMPELYSQVVDVISNRGMELAAREPSHQVAEVFLNIPVVSLILRTEIPRHRANLSDDACQAILRTLHEIGDVLWYEDIGIDYLKNRVILRPLLIIEFVRQIALQKFDSEVMPHATLKEKPYWVDLDRDRMLVMKQLLQQFHLVLPTCSEMEWESDLLVPAFWQSKESGLWLFGGDLLKNEPSLRKIQATNCVQWEYHFMTLLPDLLFDQLVIASYMNQYERQAGPDWIMYTVDDHFACRVVVTRASNTFERVLRVEAIASKSAGSIQWARFECLCEALESVLSRYNGLDVSRCFVDDGGMPRNLHTFVSEWMRTEPEKREKKPYQPPDLEWYYKKVMKGRAEAPAAA